MVETMKTYQANVERDGKFWLIHIPGIGVTQARHLLEVDEMARDLVVAMTGVTPDSFSLEVATRLPEEVQEHLRKAAQLRAESSRAQSEAAAEIRIAARQLVDTGLPLRDVGKLLGVSYQRAHQLAS